jgi:hypothetical protein
MANAAAALFLKFPNRHPAVFRQSVGVKNPSAAQQNFAFANTLQAVVKTITLAPRRGFQAFSGRVMAA